MADFGVSRFVFGSFGSLTENIGHRRSNSGPLKYGFRDVRVPKRFKSYSSGNIAKQHSYEISHRDACRFLKYPQSKCPSIDYFFQSQAKAKAFILDQTKSFIEDLEIRFKGVNVSADRVRDAARADHPLFYKYLMDEDKIKVGLIDKSVVLKELMSCSFNAWTKLIKNESDFQDMLLVVGVKLDLKDFNSLEDVPSDQDWQKDKLHARRMFLATDSRTPDLTDQLAELCNYDKVPSFFAQQAALFSGSSLMHSVSGDGTDSLNRVLQKCIDSFPRGYVTEDICMYQEPRLEMDISLRSEVELESHRSILLNRVYGQLGDSKALDWYNRLRSYSESELNMINKLLRLPNVRDHKSDIFSSLSSFKSLAQKIVSSSFSTEEHPLVPQLKEFLASYDIEAVKGLVDLICCFNSAKVYLETLDDLTLDQVFRVLPSIDESKLNLLDKKLNVLTTEKVAALSEDQLIKFFCQYHENKDLRTVIYRTLSEKLLKVNADSASDKFAALVFLQHETLGVRSVNLLKKVLTEEAFTDQEEISWLKVKASMEEKYEFLQYGIAPPLYEVWISTKQANLGEKLSRELSGDLRLIKQMQSRILSKKPSSEKYSPSKSGVSRGRSRSRTRTSIIDLFSKAVNDQPLVLAY